MMKKNLFQLGTGTECMLNVENHHYVPVSEKGAFIVFVDIKMEADSNLLFF